MAIKAKPTSEAKWSLFLNNLSEKLPQYSAGLGVSAADLAMLAAIAANFTYLVNYTAQLKDAVDSYFRYKQQMMKGALGSEPTPPVLPSCNLPEAGMRGMIRWVLLLVRRIEASPGFTEQIGDDLGLIVINPGPSPDIVLIPSLRFQSEPDGIVITKYGKKKQTGLRLEYKLVDEAEWIHLGDFTRATIAQQLPANLRQRPEMLNYRGRLLKNDVPVGEYSPVYTVITRP